MKLLVSFFKEGGGVINTQTPQRVRSAKEKPLVQLKTIILANTSYRWDTICLEKE